MHPRVQGLDATVHHLGEASVVAHFDDLDAILGQQLGGAAGGKNLDVAVSQELCKLDHAGLIGNADERTLNGNAVICHFLVIGTGNALRVAALGGDDVSYTVTRTRHCLIQFRAA